MKREGRKLIKYMFIFPLVGIFLAIVFFNNSGLIKNYKCISVEVVTNAMLVTASFDQESNCKRFPIKL